MQVPSTNHKVYDTFDNYYNNNLIISGQTLKHVGVWLRTQVFTHGQLYVACSRVGKPGSLKFAVMKKDGVVEDIPNVVFKEVLLDNV